MLLNNNNKTEFYVFCVLKIPGINEHALNLLKELEALKIIRIQEEKGVLDSTTENLINMYKGAMTTQPMAEIDKQLSYLRKECD